jgi:hypothetical protein
MIPVLAMTSKSIHIALANSPSCGAYLIHKGMIPSVVFARSYPLVKHVDMVVEWLKIDPNGILEAVIGEGNLKIFAFLLAHFSRLHPDHRAEKVAYYLSAENGRLDFLKWLASAYPITKDDVRGPFSNCFGYQPSGPVNASRARPFTIKWRDDMLLRACHRWGRDEVTRWLIDQYYTEDEAKAIIDDERPLMYFE